MFSMMTVKEHHENSNHHEAPFHNSHQCSHITYFITCQSQFVLEDFNFSENLRFDTKGGDLFTTADNTAALHRSKIVYIFGFDEGWVGPCPHPQQINWKATFRLPNGGFEHRRLFAEESAPF